MKRYVAALLVVLLVGVVGVLAIGAGYAKDEKAAKAKCSEATLHGTYLFAVKLIDITGNNQVPGTVAGYQVFNGNGRVKQVSSVNINGEVERNIRDKATYTVKGDCTGTVTFKDGSQLDAFIATDGSMLTAVRTKPFEEIVTSGFLLRGTAKRVGQ